MKNNIIVNGIVDSNKNPFVHESWIKQGFGFTSKRQEQFENIFGQSIEKILMTQPENNNRYVRQTAQKKQFSPE